MMRSFFEDWEAVGSFLELLCGVRCPECGFVGAVGRHGFVWGLLDEAKKQSEVRARRVRCRPYRGGCGKTWSFRPADRLFFYRFTTAVLWIFLQAIIAGKPVLAA